MPSQLANRILYLWQRGPLTSDEGLAALLEAAALLEPEKTADSLEKDFQLVEVASELRKAAAEA